MTLTLNPVLEAQPFPVPLRLHRLSVEQYHQMIQAGILHSGDNIELLEGWLVEKMTKNPPHTVYTQLITDELRRLASPSMSVRIQEPISSSDSEPEPDIVLARGRIRDFLEHHPRPHQIELLIEVADATLRQDQTLKKRLYARANVAVYWIANLLEMQIEVCEEPQPALEWPDYARKEIFRAGEKVPLVLEGETHLLSVSDLLP